MCTVMCVERIFLFTQYTVNNRVFKYIVFLYFKKYLITEDLKLNFNEFGSASLRAKIGFYQNETS